LPITERDRSRLAALILLVRPAHSLASRVEQLSADHREIYERYSERMKDFIARNDIDENGERGNAWAKVLCGYGPALPDTIYTALFGALPRILKVHDDDTASRIYRDYCDELLR
jgi:hypothetical protein